MAESDYSHNAVKQEPQTGVLAQCTSLEDDRAWVVYSVHGPHYVAYADVENWTDLKAV